MSHLLVLDNADTIEAMQGTGAIWALVVGDCTAGQRAGLIDHHSKIMAELRRRGHRVRAGMVTDEYGRETMTLRLVDRNAPAWRVPEPGWAA